MCYIGTIYVLYRDNADTWSASLNSRDSCGSMESGGRPSGAQHCWVCCVRAWACVAS